MPYTSLNRYFLVPYLIWAAIGGVLLLCFDKQVLFAAVNTHYSSVMDVLMYYATWIGEGATITIISLLLLGVSSLRNWWYFVTALACNVLPTIVTHSIKRFINAPRPLKYFDNAAWVHVSDGWEKLFNYSFPSGHSTGTFSFFCLLAMLLPEKKRGFGLLFFLLALTVGYSRIYLSAHFFADVYAGSLIGGGLAFVCFYVMQHYKPRFLKGKQPNID